MVGSFFAINLLAIFPRKSKQHARSCKNHCPMTTILHHSNIHQAYGGSYQSAEYLLQSNLKFISRDGESMMYVSAHLIAGTKQSSPFAPGLLHSKQMFMAQIPALIRQRSLAETHLHIMQHRGTCLIEISNGRNS